MAAEADRNERLKPLRLAAANLRKAYRGRAVVVDVSLAVASGQIVGLLGPNGAGKTTCFYMILGLTRADAGAIHLGERDLTDAPMHIRARAGIGYLPQEASVFRKLTVADNLLAVAQLQRGLERSEQRRLVERLLEDFHLEGIRDNLGERLSGGERRRVEIARALAGKPRMMLLDEPFAGVDPISVAELKDEIRALAGRDLGVLVTDHNVRETLDICDQAYIVSAGQVIAEGTPDEILRDKTVRRVYLGEGFHL